MQKYGAIVLAGGTGRRLGGTAKPTLRVGGLSLLRRVLAAVTTASPVVVVGHVPGGVPTGVLTTVEDPPGSGPAAATAAGLALLPHDVTEVALLAVDLPFLTPPAIARLRDELAAPSSAGRPGDELAAPSSAAGLGDELGGPLSGARDELAAPSSAGRPGGELAGPLSAPAGPGQGAGPGGARDALAAASSAARAREGVAGLSPAARERAENAGPPGAARLGGEAVAQPRDASSSSIVDGVLYVDGDGRRQLLCGVWRTASLRAALDRLSSTRDLAGASMRALFADLAIREVSLSEPGPPPWFDCDTDDDLRQAEEWAR